jgi:membrane-associated PAP2 superfamily phosphatase
MATSSSIDPPTAVTRWWLLLAWAAVSIVWDFSGADMAVMQRVGTPSGFAFRSHWLTSGVLHEGGRMLGLVAVVWLLLSLVRPTGHLRLLDAPQRRWCLLTVVMAWAVVMILRSRSHTSCPWSMIDFGGVANHVSHWRWSVRDGGPGRCFPSGHATSAFALLPIPTALAARDRRLAWRWTVGLVAFGLVLGAGQSLRGAHHPSHALWTGWVCAAVSVVSWSVWMRWRSKRVPSDADAARR